MFEEVYEIDHAEPPAEKIFVGDPLVFLSHFRRSVYREYGEFLDKDKNPDYRPGLPREDAVVNSLDDLEDLEVISEEDVQSRTNKVKTQSPGRLLDVITAIPTSIESCHAHILAFFKSWSKHILKHWDQYFDGIQSNVNYPKYGVFALGFSSCITVPLIII